MTKRELQRDNNQLRDALEQARFRVDELDEIIVDALGIEDDEDADEDEAEDEEEERGE
jgi:hypothetical protein